MIKNDQKWPKMTKMKPKIMNYNFVFWSLMFHYYEPDLRHGPGHPLNIILKTADMSHMTFFIWRFSLIHDNVIFSPNFQRFFKNPRRHQWWEFLNLITFDPMVKMVNRTRKTAGIIRFSRPNTVEKYNPQIYHMSHMIWLAPWIS